MTSIKISIIIATFNAAKTLERCLDSIFKQTYKNYELVVIDGGSTDKTIDVLNNNNNKITYWISESDNGIYDAWNKGVVKATGDWILFLGADDYLYANDTIEKYVLALNEVPKNIKIAYSKVQLINHKQDIVFSIGDDWNISKKNFLKHMCLPHQGLLHHRSLLNQNSLFNADFKIAGDYELLLRELPHRDAYFYPKETVCMQVGGISSDPISSIKAVKEIRYAQKLHGQKMPNKFIFLALIRAYIRVFIFKVFGERVSYKLMDIYRVLIGKKPYWNKLS